VREGKLQRDVLAVGGCSVTYQLDILVLWDILCKISWLLRCKRVVHISLRTFLFSLLWLRVYHFILLYNNEYNKNQLIITSEHTFEINNIHF